MKKIKFLGTVFALGILLCANAQTNLTNLLVNPSFELGNGSGWTWTGADGYAWLGPNTDGDGTKDGTYINGLWNSGIGDVEFSQTITGVAAGYYQVTALVSVSANRLTNQRLFASSDTLTNSMLFGEETNTAYSAENLTILGESETYSFGGYPESAAENGPFQLLSVIQQVTNDTLTLGIRVSGKSTTKGYNFANTTNADAGFFKFDNFTLTDVSKVASLSAITLNYGKLDISFNTATETYSATVPVGTVWVTPLAISTIDGAMVTGTDSVDVSGGSGTSIIKITSLDGTNENTYTINYKVAASPDATLSSLSVDKGILLPAFDPSIVSYTISLPIGTETMSVSAVVNNFGASVVGTGEIDVTSGIGTADIVVTAENKTDNKTYKIAFEVFSFSADAQQDKLYTNEFAVGDVTLLDGPFKHASELNIETLLKYDVDRLLAPYRKEAGLTAKATSYTNWIGLDGHIGGHYLTALAINYAATGDTECKRLMDYMVDELKDCHDANAINNSSWGVGYVGGVPSSSGVWSTFKTGNFTNYNSAWVPWYNLHKTYAGLRDAWLYGNNSTAKDLFLSFCDWAVTITSQLSDTQMETMLAIEHGGMNEVLADAYQMSGDDKYMVAAKRFSHKVLLNSMAAKNDNLDNMHANTQVPKAVGFQRVAEMSHDAIYVKAAQFFWQTVVDTRSLALGGNSRKEYFPEASASMDYINNVEGPESCNTNNMLKLTEDLFRISPEAKYADYYERALYNHILSTQHPDHGGYVYFTPARPRHYRVYSSPNQAMWCCVGTGMENHGKYGEFIYTHVNDSLYLNLFIASELNWKTKGVKVLQETTFPDEETSKLTITADAPTSFNLMIRSPKWCAAGKLKIVVNADTLLVQSVPESYISINRTWQTGDSVRVLLPMDNRIEQLPNVPSYVAIMHGPILLGAKTGAEDLTGLVADDSRWGHIANGTLLPLDKAPILVGDKNSISSKIVSKDGEPMHFKVTDLLPNVEDTSLVLEPFYKIHDARYMMYWLSLTEGQYQKTLDSLAAAQQIALELEARTIDKVAPGEQQPEADHGMEVLNSYTGNWTNEFWRDARDGGYISYNLAPDGKANLSLMVRYWGNENGSRSFDIYIDGEKLVTENVVGKWNVDKFVNVEYEIPNSMTIGKQLITVKFQAINASNVVGGLFFVRLLKPLESSFFATKKADGNSWNVYTNNKHIIVSNLPQRCSVAILNTAGSVLHCEVANGSTVTVPCTKPGIKLVQVVSDGKVSVQKVLVQ